MVEQEVLTALTAGSPSPTAAGDRVFALVLPQKVAAARVPAVSYQRVSNIPVVSLDGHSGLDHVRMQVDSWAGTYGAAKSLASEVRTAMTAAGFKGLLATDHDEFEPETGFYRVSADYLCWED